MYYVSFISEYPIYEPAEGGYYYAGETVVECKEFQSWKKANRAYQAMKRELIDVYGHTGRVDSFDCGGCGKYLNHPATYYHSKYIGEGARVQLTRTKPHNIGRQPYC